MKGWGAGLVAVLGVALAVALTPTKTFECGPSATTPVFVTKNPEDAVTFMNGNLGVVRPSFSETNLFIAYRTLAGKPLTAAEQEQLKTGLNEVNWNYGVEPEDENKNPYLVARGMVPDVPTGRMVGQFKETDQYNAYLNCASDAFDKASETLQARVAKSGRDSADVHDWVLAQDKVFDNCDSRTASIPAAPAANASAVVKADREYQIAAANLYAEKYDEAAELFQRIGGDRGSQWHDWGLYLAGRSYIRKATIESKDEAATKAAFAEAEKVLRQAAQDPTLVKMKPKTEALLGFVTFRTNPRQRAKELAEALSGKTANGNFHQDLRDYVKLIPNARGEDDEMADWIEVVSGKEKGVDPLARWRKESRSLPWLVAALMRAAGTDKKIDDLLGAGLNVKANSAAYPTSRYHVARLWMEQGKRAEARKLVDEFLATKPKDLSASNLNMFLALRTRDAADIADFARFAERKVVAQEDEYMGVIDDVCEGDPHCPAPRMDEAGETVVNHLPIRELIALSDVKTAPEEVKLTAARLALVRALLLGDDEGLTASAGRIASMSTDLAKDVKRVLTAKTMEERKVAATLAVMAWPGAGVRVRQVDGGIREFDGFRNNWWCGTGKSAPGWVMNQPSEKNAEEYPGFLGQEQLTRAQQEQAKLQEVEAAPDFFGDVVLDWARRNPEDRGVPEALSRLVKAVHLGCGGPKSDEYGKAAFGLLHKRYPASAAAKATKYRYDSDYQPPRTRTPSSPTSVNPR